MHPDDPNQPLPTTPAPPATSTEPSEPSPQQPYSNVPPPPWPPTAYAPQPQPPPPPPQRRSRAWLVALLIGAGLIMAFLVLLGGVVDALGGGDGYSSGSGPKVGVVEIKGAIGMGTGGVSSEAVMKTIHRYSEESDLKAVLVRIDSPGGAVAPSQEIYGELKKLAKKKKVVCSMGSMAASGGFYIAMGCPTIFAEPGTLTGSIGVVSEFFNVKGIADRIDLKRETIKSGKLKDMGNPFREMTPDERAYMQALSDEIHGQFLDAVAESRNIPRAQVQQFGDGRIMTGQQALRLKLVDKMGSLQDAVAEVAEQAGLKGEPRLVYPPESRGRILEQLLGSMAGSAVQGASAELKRQATSIEGPGLYYLAQ